MSPIVNGRVLFSEIPSYFPVPGKTVTYDASQEVDLDMVDLDGGILIKTLYLSIDPYMRVRMRDPEIKSYLPAFEVGECLTGLGIGKVIRSENPKFEVGDYVYGLMVQDGPGLIVIDNRYKLPLSAYLSVLGMPGEYIIPKLGGFQLTNTSGQTAYTAWKEYSYAKKGETVFVSTGGGPVGSLVIQLAKRQGLKVIGSAGSEEKVQFMQKIGADVCFNYKTTCTRDVLLKEGGIDMWVLLSKFRPVLRTKAVMAHRYWDNVGGETLNNALEAAKFRGRVIECGMITGYNEGYNTLISSALHGSLGLTSLILEQNLDQIIVKSLTVHGFVILHFEGKYDEEFYRVMTPLVASGEIRYREEITVGLDKVGDVILAVQKGENKAKAIIQVAND
ncbi:hypothetical protein CVT26_012490 [Gymnopilus dilepis]|uniref:Enoyl reductase (ER) domain-containing protein n=1 Tax=Gymnopilus dilepis TaxID=231916 RepID=A0A409YCX6_9AGAR|nr:hypothetical protein CVT26_012490 [Gymnopilus dilepis]